MDAELKPKPMYWPWRTPFADAGAPSLIVWRPHSINWFAIFVIFALFII